MPRHKFLTFFINARSKQINLRQVNILVIFWKLVADSSHSAKGYSAVTFSADFMLATFHHIFYCSLHGPYLLSVQRTAELAAF